MQRKGIEVVSLGSLLLIPFQFSLSLLECLKEELLLEIGIGWWWVYGVTVLQGMMLLGHCLNADR